MKKKEIDNMTDINLLKNQNIQRLQFYYRYIISQDLLLKNNYTSIMEIPALDKITLNSTSNLYAIDKKNLVAAVLTLELIAGQKAKFSVAKKSIAPYKIREKQILGCKVTLRGKQLYNFLNVFISVVLPRLRDFPGISKKSLDNLGNFSFGFTNILLFPNIENQFEFFQNFRGFNINFSIIRSSPEKSHLLYTAYQLPESK